LVEFLHDRIDTLKQISMLPVSIYKDKGNYFVFGELNKPFKTTCTYAKAKIFSEGIALGRKLTEEKFSVSLCDEEIKENQLIIEKQQLIIEKQQVVLDKLQLEIKKNKIKKAEGLKLLQELQAKPFTISKSDCL
jgi:hypothetical protein